MAEHSAVTDPADVAVRDVGAPVPADDGWVRRSQTGDVDAFESLYRRHCGKIYALCLRLCGEAGEAEELTQEAFVRAWEKLGSFRGQSAFGTWLHRLAVNVVLSRWRSQGRYRDRLTAMEELLPSGSGTHWPEPRRTLDLERAIAGLPRGARTVFVLYDVEGYRHKEIAALTGLSVGACKSQLHRARRLLREVLES